MNHDEQLIKEAKAVSIEAGYVSVSMIQRKLRIGYMRAASIIELLVNLGFCEAEYMPDTARRRIITTPSTEPVLPAD